MGVRGTYQDFSYRVAHLENELVGIYSKGEPSFKKHSVSLVKQHSKKEYLSFIKERLSRIDTILSHSQEPLSSRIKAQLPAWSEKYSRLVEKLLGFDNLGENEEIAHLIADTNEKMSRIQHALLQKTAPKNDKAGFWAALKRGGVFLWNAGIDAGKRCIGRVGGRAGAWLLHASPEEEALIQEKRITLDQVTGDQAAASFASKLSEHLVDYLEEHLVHIQERDVALRPPWLSTFFQDPYVSEPVPNALGSLMIQLLSSGKADLKKMVEINVLNFLHNVYAKTNEAFAQSPHALTSLVHDTLAKTLEEVQREHSQNEPLLGSAMGNVERNSLLSGEVTHTLVAVFLKMGFPNGASDVYIPSRMVNYFARDVLWSTLSSGLEEVLKSVLMDMSEHTDVEQELLLKGYREINDFLSPPSEKEKIGREREREMGKSIFIELLIALFGSFFSSVRSSFHEPKKQEVERMGVDYAGREDLTKKVEEVFGFLLPETGFIGKLGRTIATKTSSSLSTQLSDSLREFAGNRCMNQVFSQLNDIVKSTSSITDRFPRTARDVQRGEERRIQLRQERTEAIQQEERKLKMSSPLIAKKIVEYKGFNTTPYSRDELQAMWPITRLIRTFLRFFKILLNTLFEKVLLALFWAIDLPSKIERLNRKFRTSLENIPQDAFVLFMMNWLGKRADSILSSADQKTAAPPA